MPSFRKLETMGNTWLEIGVRAILAFVFLQLEHATPFTRKIHPDEIWLYRNPRTEDFVPSSVLWPLVLTVPIGIFLIHFVFSRDKSELYYSLMALSLALGLNGVFTDVLKLLVGRPRPDFFWRCFPNGEQNSDMECTGDPRAIMEGRKSFPSGHSSFSFASMSFLTWYFMGKLHVFNEQGRGQSWRLCVSLLPILVSSAVAVSRTCDYHHHWQDVLVGSLIGTALSYLCYRQYYPPLNSKMSHRSYAHSLNRPNGDTHLNSIKSKSAQTAESNSFVTDEKETKWI